MAELHYDDHNTELRSDLHDGPPKVHERLREWAADDELPVRLLPPRLRRHAERLVPKEGRRRLPEVFLAAVAAEWSEAEEPRGKTLARRYERYIVNDERFRKWKFLACERGLYDSDAERPTDEARRLLARDPYTPEEIIRRWLQRAL